MTTINIKRTKQNKNKTFKKQSVQRKLFQYLREEELHCAFSGWVNYAMGNYISHSWPPVPWPSNKEWKFVCNVIIKHIILVADNFSFSYHLSGKYCSQFL